MLTKIAKLLEDMAMAAQVAYPRECCGIITKDLDYISSINTSQNPKTSFIIDPVTMLKHEDNIWGFFHSHPSGKDPIPSRNDIIDPVFQDYKFIVGFSNQFYIYWMENNNIRFEKLNENHFKI